MLKRFQTIRADGSVEEHELQHVAHFQFEPGDRTIDTWAILPDEVRPIEKLGSQNEH